MIRIALRCIDSSAIPSSVFKGGGIGGFPRWPDHILVYRTEIQCITVYFILFLSYRTSNFDAGHNNRKGGDMPPEIPMLRTNRGFDLINTLLQLLLTYMSLASGGFAPKSRPPTGAPPCTQLGLPSPRLPVLSPSKANSWLRP